jgi:hypothetical protein
MEKGGKVTVYILYHYLYIYMCVCVIIYDSQCVCVANFGDSWKFFGGTISKLKFNFGIPVQCPKVLASRCCKFARNNMFADLPCYFQV